MRPQDAGQPGGRKGGAAERRPAAPIARAAESARQGAPNTDTPK